MRCLTLSMPLEGALVEQARRRVFASPRADLKLGCNFSRYTSASSRYAKFISKAFDFATLPFYAGRTVPQRDHYDYGYVDNALTYLQEQGITAKGHPLFFGHKEVNPSWMFGLTYSELRRETAKIAKHHVSAYADTIRFWDSTNEAHDWANCFELNQEQLVDLTRATTSALREASDKAVYFFVLTLSIISKYSIILCLPALLLNQEATYSLLSQTDAYIGVNSSNK